jgi:two-component system, OmpR family, sensor kinase
VLVSSALTDLLALVEKLLLLARTEAGQGLSHDSVDLYEVVTQASDMVRPLCEQKGLKLTVKALNPITVCGDALALGLMLRNLLENACKFTELGEVSLQVRQEGQEVSLMVEDTGQGISAEALPHLFERFYQADVRHRRTGSGLGLALVKSIATWHGGTVWAGNRDQGGARFVVTLPVAKRGEAATLEGTS